MEPGDGPDDPAENGGRGIAGKWRMMSSLPLRMERRARVWEAAGLGMRTALRPLQAMMSARTALFLAALTAMLLRHPDVPFFAIDRVAFGLLVLGVIGRAAVMRQPLIAVEGGPGPLMGLSLLGNAWLAGQARGAPTGSRHGNRMCSVVRVACHVR